MFKFLIVVASGLFSLPAAAAEPKVKAVQGATLLVVMGKECAAARNDPDLIEFAKGVAAKSLLDAGFSEREASGMVDTMASKQDPSAGKDKAASAISCGIIDKAKKLNPSG